MIINQPITGKNFNLIKFKKLNIAAIEKATSALANTLRYDKIGSTFLETLFCNFTVVSKSILRYVSLATVYENRVNRPNIKIDKKNKVQRKFTYTF